MPAVPERPARFRQTDAGVHDGGVTGDVAEAFRTERSRLFALAYRLPGSASDAEDVLQSAFEKWIAADGDAVTTPAAWLTGRPEAGNRTVPRRPVLHLADRQVRGGGEAGGGGGERPARRAGPPGADLLAVIVPEFGGTGIAALHVVASPGKLAFAARQMTVTKSLPA